MTDWSPAEDRRPGLKLGPAQPEKTAGGDLYTFVVTFRGTDLDPPNPGDVPCYTQMTIRDDHTEYLTDHGRVYIPQEEDGA